VPVPTAAQSTIRRQEFPTSKLAEVHPRRFVAPILDLGTYEGVYPYTAASVSVADAIESWQHLHPMRTPEPLLWQKAMALAIHHIHCAATNVFRFVQPRQWPEQLLDSQVLRDRQDRGRDRQPG